MANSEEQRRDLSTVVDPKYGLDMDDIKVAGWLLVLGLIVILVGPYVPLK